MCHSAGHVHSQADPVTLLQAPIFYLDAKSSVFTGTTPDP